MHYPATLKFFMEEKIIISVYVQMLLSFWTIWVKMKYTDSNPVNKISIIMAPKY